MQSVVCLDLCHGMTRSFLFIYFFLIDHVKPQSTFTTCYAQTKSMFHKNMDICHQGGLKY